MLSQFSREGNHQTLADLDFEFPKDVYPIGRLDSDSEGLLLLTNDSSLNKKLLNPDNSHFRTYLVQVEGEINQNACNELAKGVDITVNGRKYHTLPARAHIPDTLPIIPDRNPPIRFRKSVPTSWVLISLKEGKNRQVRKMTAAVGFPTLRLIRFAMCGLNIEGAKPGKVISINKNDIIH